MADIIAAKTVEDRMVVIASDDVSPDDVANDVIGIDSKEKREKALLKILGLIMFKQI